MPFRSQVINGAQTKEDRRREAIGFEIPVTRGAFDQEKEAPMTSSITQETTLAIKSCETRVKMYKMPESWRAQAT